MSTNPALKDTMQSTGDSAPFSFGTRLGLVFIVQASCLSEVAVLSLLVYIAYSSIKLRRQSSRKWSTGTHVHYYFLSMLISEAIQAIGGIMNLKWVINADVGGGAFCSAQGILKQVGDVGVALASLAIAVHTFSVLVVRWRPDPSPRTAILVLTCIWLFIALNIGINAALNGKKGYWGNTGKWCWITERYQVQQIVLEYLWMWLTSLLSLVLYIPIALVIKGKIIVERGKIRFLAKNDQRVVGLIIPQHARDANGVALQMIFYPLIYIITVLPIAVVRWRGWIANAVVPFPATVFADVLFASSGLFNVLLFSVTRPSLLPRRGLSSDDHVFTFTSSQRHDLQQDTMTFAARNPREAEDSSRRLDGHLAVPERSLSKAIGVGRLPNDDTDADGDWLSARRLKNESTKPHTPL